MTETATGQQAAQSVNGAAPGPAAEPAEPDTGEKWLGILMLAASVFLAFVAIDRLMDGRLTAGFYGSDDASG